MKNDQFVSTQKIDFAVDEGKERLNPSREKNEGKPRRRKVEESCVTFFLLCDPGWYVHKPDVQNKWDDNTHTHVTSIIDPPLGESMRVA